MSLDDFLKFLQDILTMVEPGDANSVKLGKISVGSIVDLALNSGKVDPMTARVMREVTFAYENLVKRKKEFAGERGKFDENEQKRRRLTMVLHPRC